MQHTLSEPFKLPDGMMFVPYTNINDIDVGQHIYVKRGKFYSNCFVTEKTNEAVFTDTKKKIIKNIHDAITFKLMVRNDDGTYKIDSKFAEISTKIFGQIIPEQLKSYQRLYITDNILSDIKQTDPIAKDDLYYYYNLSDLKSTLKATECFNLTPDSVKKCHNVLNVNFIIPLKGVLEGCEKDILDRKLMTSTSTFDEWLKLIPFLCKYNGSDIYYTFKRTMLIEKTEFKKISDILIQKYNEKYLQNLFTHRAFALAIKSNFIEKVKINSVNPDIILIGDLHSSFLSLLNILNVKKSIFETNFTLKPNNYIFFLGDIVDRGPYGIELLALVYQLKINNIDNVFIIKGNHEDHTTYNAYGLGREYFYHFDNKDASIAYQSYTEQLPVFDIINKYLPTAIFLYLNNNIYQLCHGGIDMQYMEVMDDYKPHQKILYKTENINKLRNFLENDAQNMLILSSYGFMWNDFTNNNGLQIANERYDENTQILIKSIVVDTLRTYMNIFNTMKETRTKKSIRDFVHEYKPDAKDTDVTNIGHDVIRMHLLEQLKAIDSIILLYGKNMVIDYLKYNGIKAIISGHQDVSNITFVADANATKFENDKKYNNLYTIKNYRSAKMNHPYSFIPGTDFYALNTSSAVSSKGNIESLLYDCYLTLTP